MNSRTSDNIRLSFSGKWPLKKVHRIAGRTFIIIDESLTKLLSINENTTWLEQQATENGILMKIHYFNEKGNQDIVRSDDDRIETCNNPNIVTHSSLPRSKSNTAIGE